MLFENILFYVFYYKKIKNRFYYPKIKNSFLLSNIFFNFFFVLQNKKLSLKTISKQGPYFDYDFNTHFEITMLHIFN